MFKSINLALNRSKSIGNYRKFQTFIAENSIRRLTKKGYSFSNKFVLELGAGYGGYSKILNDISGSFLAADIITDDWFQQNRIPFMQFDVNKPFPIQEGSIDFIYSSSLIEHVPDPKFFITNIWNVLREGGILYLSFPPFYTIAMVGGHQFKPFHLLGEKIAIQATNLIHGTNYTGYSSAYSTFGLYRRTITQIKSLLEQCRFDIRDIYTRMSPINTTRLPGFLKDLMTWHVCFLARK